MTLKLKRKNIRIFLAGARRIIVFLPKKVPNSYGVETFHRRHLINRTFYS